MLEKLFENIEQNTDKMFSIATGIVKENYSKNFPGMVKVEIVMREKNHNLTDWIRVCMPYAGNGYGAYLLPEVGDEVIIAFDYGDINRPFVIGSLWNGKDKIPEKTVTEKNDVKKIRTKGGHEIIFTEEKGKEKLEIHTPKNLKIYLNDEKKLIEITDDKGDNQISIDGEGGKINVKAKTQILLDTGGQQVNVDGQGKSISIKADTINIEANNSIKIKSQMLNVEGQSTTVKAGGTMDISSNAVLNIKGTPVKIN